MSYLLPRTLLGYFVLLFVVSVFVKLNSVQYFSESNSEIGMYNTLGGGKLCYGWPLAFHMQYPHGFIGSDELAGFDVSPVRRRVSLIALAGDIITFIAVAVASTSICDCIISRARRVNVTA